MEYLYQVPEQEATLQKKRHVIYRKPHGVKTLQPEVNLHGRLRAAGNGLINDISQLR